MVTRNMFGSMVPAKPGQARTTRNWRTHRLRTLVRKKNSKTQAGKKKFLSIIWLKILFVLQSVRCTKTTAKDQLSKVEPNSWCDTDRRKVKKVRLLRAGREEEGQHSGHILVTRMSIEERSQQLGQCSVTRLEEHKG